MRIRGKISLLVIPLATVPLILLGLFSYRSLVEGFKEQAYLENQQLSLAAANQVEEILDDCYESLLLLSSRLSQSLVSPVNGSLEALLGGAEHALHGFAQDLALRHGPHLQVRFVSPEGKELFKTHGLTNDGKLGSVLADPFFLQAVAISANVNPSSQFPASKGATTFFKALAKDGALVGLLFVDLDLQALSNALAESAASQAAYYFLLDGAGSHLANGGTPPAFESQSLKNKYLTALENRQHEAAGSFVQSDFEVAGKRFYVGIRPVKEYISFLEPIPEERWYLGMVRSELPMLARFRAAQIIFWTILGVGLGFAVLGTVYFSKKITTPISQLTKTSKEFAKGNLDSRVEVTSEDEIGQLAADFGGMARDLKRLMAERRANESLIAVGRFSAALAHDLRNPVEGLKLLSHELKKRTDEARPEYEVADTISQSVDNLTSLINQSLDFTRLSEPVLLPADLTKLSDEVLADFRFDEVEFTKDYGNDLPKVQLDATQIKRVLTNLVKNAQEACVANRGASKRAICLRLRVVDNWLRIEIADTGAGIRKEVRETIFEPFFSTKPGGHGLGLALTRQIISNHGGTISFSSELGKGATFVIELPVA